MSACNRARPPFFFLAQVVIVIPCRPSTRSPEQEARTIQSKPPLYPGQVENKLGGKKGSRNKNSTAQTPLCPMRHTPGLAREREREREREEKERKTNEVHKVTVKRVPRDGFTVQGSSEIVPLSSSSPVVLVFALLASRALLPSSGNTTYAGRALFFGTTMTGHSVSWWLGLGMVYMLLSKLCTQRRDFLLHGRNPLVMLFLHTRHPSFNLADMLPYVDLAAHGVAQAAATPAVAGEAARLREGCGCGHGVVREQTGPIRLPPEGPLVRHHRTQPRQRRQLRRTIDGGGRQGHGGRAARTPVHVLGQVGRP